MTGTQTRSGGEKEFEAAHPDYDVTRPLSDLRKKEYSRLDRLGHVYLDYTGGGLYATSQVREHLRLLESEVFGNPHSHNPTSGPITELIERCRRAVLAYFKASEDEYVAVFTANASQALKLVGEAYPFGPDGHYLLTFDNHNSVNGIREFARVRHATITYVPLSLPEMRVDEEKLPEYLGLARPGADNLFAYPAQSNFSGVQHPLDWIPKAKAMGWDVLLDAAAFVATNALDLGEWHPDFVSVSFYKMFGYPTGVGCLVARREALAKLQRPWFAGGTITVASVQGDRYFLAEGASAFEDGTPDYLGIPGVEIGLRHLQAAGLDLIHSRCRCLTDWLIQELLSLRHSNGTPLVRVYGPLDTRQRGATVTVNLYDPAGGIMDHLRVEQAATERRISLRTGCFCNPGAGEIAFTVSRETLLGGEFGAGMPLDDYVEAIGLPSGGAVRVSLGLVSNLADVERFLAFAGEFVDLAGVPDDLPPRVGC